ncbi:MAG: hypothetical protein HY545_01510 [Candidatus Doudnabacteria bacterium]|nr:hypothetical protein [Candidatus Doudnabacteria bacterium]
MNQKLLPVGELIKQSWELFKANFKTFFVIALLLTVVSVIPSLASRSFPSAETDAPLTPWTGVGFLVGAIIVVFISLWGELALLSEALTPGQSLGNLFSSTVDKIGAVLFISFMVGLIVIAGIILLIIPGIIFSIWYAFAPIILLDEKLRGWEALKSSRELVKGFFGQVFSRLFAAAIIFGAIYIPLTIIFKQNPVVNDIVTGILSLFLGPLFVIYEVMLYKNLKEIKSVPQEIPQTNEPQA